jgi:hypothetical protein
MPNQSWFDLLCSTVEQSQRNGKALAMKAYIGRKEKFGEAIPQLYDQFYYPIKTIADQVVPEATIAIDVDGDGGAEMIVLNHNSWWVYWKDFKEIGDWNWQTIEGFNEWAEGVAKKMRERKEVNQQVTLCPK